jgi:probable rRNA maturation factor
MTMRSAKSLLVDVSSDGTRASVGRAAAAAIVRDVLRAERIRHALVSVTFVSAPRIRSLNRRHLHHHGATDVISFGFTRANAADPVIGDIYIAPAVARANAAANGVGIREELARLLIHGTLHVLGYEHPDGDDTRRERSAMWKRQEALLRRWRAGTSRGAR